MEKIKKKSMKFQVWKVFVCDQSMVEMTSAFSRKNLSV